MTTPGPATSADTRGEYPGRLGGQAVTLIGAILAGTMAGLLGGDPRPVFVTAGILTLLTVTVAWFAGLRREQLPAGVLAS